MPDEEHETADWVDDKLVLDDLAELFRLPEWQVGGSGSDFIECAADLVGSARDLSRPAHPDTLIAYDYVDLEGDDDA